MIPFIEKTWFLLWVVANVFILRWFHMFSSDTEETFDGPALGEKKAVPIASGRITSGSRNRQFV